MGLSSIVRCINSSFFSSGIYFILFLFTGSTYEHGFLVLALSTDHTSTFADVIFVFFAEEFDAAGNRAGSGVAQWTE